MKYLPIAAVAAAVLISGCVAYPVEGYRQDDRGAYRDGNRRDNRDSRRDDRRDDNRRDYRDERNGRP